MSIKVITPGDESTLEALANSVAAMNYPRVLDVGGLEKPLRPATHVLDLYGYESRRVDEGRGSPPERFTAETWTVWDANVVPWPYPTGFFDFVWCCQVVEDIRDPIAVCKEIMRVGQAGIVSTVHRSYESSTVQADGVVGYHHHRWLIEAHPPHGLEFIFKSPILQVNRAMRPSRALDWLLTIEWAGAFDVQEKYTGGDTGQRRELVQYLERIRVKHGEGS